MQGIRWPTVLVITATAVAGCTSVQEGLSARGYPPAYAEGYEQGCASGKAAAGGLFSEAQQDRARYQDSDSEYAQGWDAGSQKCLADMRAMVIAARARKPSRDK
jgi:hypothetical protein